MTTGAEVGQEELPAGWKWVKLGDVAEAIRGVTFKSGVSTNEPRGGYVPCVTTSAVQSQPDWSTARYIPANSVRHNRQMLQPGDVLVSTANSKALVGKSCLLDAVPFDCTFGAFVTVIRPNISVDRYWLANYMNGDSAKRFFYEKSSNTTNISNLRVSDLLETDIPLPPLEEQKRIAGILNEQMAAVEEAKKAAQERLEAARALPAAYLMEVFPSSEDELPEGWKWVKLGDVSSLITKGTTPTSFGAEYVPSGIPFIRATEVHGGAIDGHSAQFHIDEPTHQQLKRSQIVPGDLLITIAGTLGRAAYCPDDAPPMNCNQAVAITRLERTAVDVEYVCWACQSPQLIEPLLRQKAGGALQNLNLQQIGNFTIPLPPLGEQQRIASELDDKLAGVKLAEASIQQELDTIEAMPAALLRKAFAGEM